MRRDRPQWEGKRNPDDAAAPQRSAPEWRLDGRVKWNKTGRRQSAFLKIYDDAFIPDRTAQALTHLAAQYSKAGANVLQMESGGYDGNEG